MSFICTSGIVPVILMNVKNNKKKKLDKSVPNKQRSPKITPYEAIFLKK